MEMEKGGKCESLKGMGLVAHMASVTKHTRLKDHYI